MNRMIPTSWLSSIYTTLVGFVLIMAMITYFAYWNFQRKADIAAFAAESKPRMVVYTKYRSCRSAFFADPAEYCLAEAAVFASQILSEAEAFKAAMELAHIMGISVPLLERNAGISHPERPLVRSEPQE